MTTNNNHVGTQYTLSHFEDLNSNCTNRTRSTFTSPNRSQISNTRRRSSLNSWSMKCNSSSLPTTQQGDSGFATSTNERDVSTDGSVCCSDKLTNKSSRNKKSPVFSSTSVEVHSTDRSGKKETMKAILEGTAFLQGSIQMDGIKNLSLTLNYKKPEAPKETIESLEDRRSRQDVKIDECELMKDCSKETVAKSTESFTRYHKEEHIKSFTSKEEINITEVCRTETYEYGSPKTLEIKSFKEHYSGESSSSENESLYSTNTFTHTEKTECVKVENYEDVIEEPVNETEKMGSVTDQLKQVTSELDEVLMQPGGKASIITSLKKIYGSSLGRLLYGK